jgi:hypothetical protein
MALLRFFDISLQIFISEDEFYMLNCGIIPSLTTLLSLPFLLKTTSFLRHFRVMSLVDL